jgi:NitT/TauT family transport system ATP-binding protein
MADTGHPIVEIKRVSKVFQLQDQTIHALSDASLSIRKGEFVCLIGASGCGKSTLLRIMAGFEQPSSGEALMWGKPIAEPDPSRGMVFQDYALFPWLSVRENIAFGPIARGLTSAQVKQTVDKFIELVGLGKFANAYPHQLSGGMKQRVAIARVLANDAELVLMDEPFGALDEQTRLLLGDKVLQIQDQLKQTCLLITHNITEAVQLADRVLVMTYRPGQVKRIVPIELTRPRSSEIVSSDAFGRYVAQIWGDLREEASRGMRDDEKHRGGKP